VTDETEDFDSATAKQLAHDLHQTIIDELESKILLMIPSNRVSYYNVDDTILGEYIVSSFPEIREDAAEAGNCFALGRYTACVFHLTRMMENIVQRFGRRLKIRDLHKKPWGQILGESKHKIDKMPKDTPSRERRSNRYYESYALLDAVCRATRNPTIHPKITDIKKTYTDQEAKDLMDRVKQFIEDFSRLR